MSIDRVPAPILVALAALLSLAAPLAAQEPAARPAALLVLTAPFSAQTPQTSPEQTTSPQQTTDDDPQSPTGVDDLPVVPDPNQRPGEPPPLFEDEDGEVDRDEEGLGTFFLTSFALATAYDELGGDESEMTPSDEGGPADSTVDGEGEIAYLFRPTFLFVHRPDARGTFSVGYEPELETLEDQQDEERVSHSAGLLWDRRMTRRTDFTAGASYLDSLDPTRHLGGEGFVLIPGRFEQSRAFFGASHLWPRATRLHFYSEYTNAESELDADDPALEVTDLSGTVALEQGIGRHSDFTLSYSYTDTELESVDSTVPAPTRFSGPVDSVRAGFGHRIGTYSFHLSAGALREQAEEDDVEDETTWIGGLEVARETDTLLMRLRYDHSLFAFGYGDTTIPSGAEGPLAGGAVLRDTEADTLSFFLELLPTNRVRLEQSIWLSRESLVEDDHIDSFVTGTLLEVLLTGRSVHRLILFSRFDYYDRDESDLLGGALSRTRFSLGFRVGLTGPQTKVGQRLATTELRKVLPTGGRL